MEKIFIYTDGACSGNPGPGGWGALLMFRDQKKEFSGGQKNTTNNIMELTAVIEALKKLKDPCPYAVEIYSDSAYVVNGFEKGWVENWRKKGWVNASKEPVKNQALWQELYDLVQKYQAKFIKVKGHSDNVYNNRCDEMARSEIKKL